MRIYKVYKGRTYEKEDLLKYIVKHVKKRYRIFFRNTETGVSYRAVSVAPWVKGFSIQKYDPVRIEWSGVSDF